MTEYLVDYAVSRNGAIELEIVRLEPGDERGRGGDDGRGDSPQPNDPAPSDAPVVMTWRRLADVGAA